MKPQIPTGTELAAFIGGLSVVFVVSTGCGRKPVDSFPKTISEAPVSQPTATAVIARGPVPQTMPVAVAPIARNATVEEAAAQLTMELRKYVAYTRSIPKDFDDFVAHHRMNYPLAPAGKQYVIEHAKVVVR